MISIDSSAFTTGKDVKLVPAPMGASNVTDTGKRMMFDVEDLPARVPRSQAHSVDVNVSLYRPGAFVESTSLAEFVGAALVPSFTQRRVWLATSPVLPAL